MTVVGAIFRVDEPPNEVSPPPLSPVPGMVLVGLLTTTM